jgi:D-glycero-D-manno-heptose 1,7-bisphosphate phosphatase
LIAGVKEHLALVQWKERGIRVGIASNQAGVALGYLTEETAHDLLGDMFFDAFGFFGREDLIQLCPHAPNAGCKCRKPNPGMIDLIRFEARASKRKTLFVGDLGSDQQAAENAGVHFQWAWDFFGKSKGKWVGWLQERANADLARTSSTG